MIIVSGIPCSGKGRCADFISRQLKQEEINSACFKMPTVQDCLKHNTDSFIQEMLRFKQTSDAKVIVASLPSYNHLKKCIFELKRSETFSKVFDIKYVLTKVCARNFYQNKNRNLYQYLVENCMKGVSNAVILETGNMP